MLPFQIKICGVTSSEDALFACRCGADAIGLNFYAKSSRFVNHETAILISASIDEFNRGNRDKALPPVQKIGVFVDSSAQQIVEIAGQVGLDGIQLHGNESPEIVGSIRAAIDDSGIACFLIRAVRSKPVDSGVGDAEASKQRVYADIVSWLEQQVDLILLDAASPGEFGGTGKVVDLSMIPDVATDVPFILAGGLTPGNVFQAIQESGYRSVDVASGVESKPGVKEPRKVRTFVAEARRAFKS